MTTWQKKIRQCFFRGRTWSMKQRAKRKLTLRELREAWKAAGAAATSGQFQ